MQNRKAILSFLSIGFILSLAWIFLLISESILQENSNHNLLHVPNNANFAMRLDGKEIAERTLFSVFLESKDPDVLELIQETIDKNIKKDGKFKNYGIDYLSDLVVFEVPYKNTAVQGFLVNISNERLFRKNLIGTDKIFACQDNVGVILSTTSKKNSKLLKTELQALAKKIVLNMPGSSTRIFKHTQGSGKFIETYNKGSFFGKSSLFGRSTILFELQKNSLQFSGDVVLNSNTKNKPKVLQDILKPKGLHVSTSLIPTDFADSLNNWLDQFGVALPAIEQISLNLNGTKVINHSSGFFIVPQMELLIKCEKEVSIKKLLSTPSLQAYFDYQLDNESISFQDEKLYFKQISSNSFYIGITENPSFGKNKGNNLFCIEGSLQPLTKIEGGGLMTTFLEMMPIYRASKNLAAHTQYLNIKLTKKTTDMVQLKGDLRFLDAYSPMNELVKFLLVGQVIK